MELVYRKGFAPRFPFEQFLVCEQKYAQQEEKPSWKNLETLRSFSRTRDGPMARIVGTIDADTSKKWLGWERGQLFAVAYCGGLCFCIPGGTIVVPKPE